MSRCVKNFLLMFFGILFVALVSVTSVSATVWYNRSIGNKLKNTWAASAEFYQLESGQDRFSEHATNIGGTYVIVDHDTGIQYLSNENGMTVLLEENGTPKRVAETG